MGGKGRRSHFGRHDRHYGTHQKKDTACHTVVKNFFKQNASAEDILFRVHVIIFYRLNIQIFKPTNIIIFSHPENENRAAV